MVEKRNIGLCIFLTIITCGIYSIYWFIKITDDVSRVSNNNEMTGGKAFLFTLLTCGIYGYYWAYQIGKNLNSIEGNNENDQSVLYLVLQILGLGIVNYGLIQNELNKYADA